MTLPPVPYDARQMELRMQHMMLGADMARSLHAITVRLADYREAMQRLHNELELMHQDSRRMTPPAAAKKSTG